MRKFACIGLGLFTWVSVAACAHHLDETRASVATWNLHVAGSEAKLAYGMPNSDLVGLMMTCERGSKAVRVSGDVTAERPVLVLASGGSQLKLKGAAEPDPYTDGLWLEADAPVGEAALKRFARTGDLKLKRRMGALEMDASAEARGDIRRFFAHCDA